MKNEKAILVIDMTNDFVKDVYCEYASPVGRDNLTWYGKLVAPLGKTIIEPIGKIVDKAIEYEIPVVYLQDLHTKDSEEIKSKTWPEHCMKGTPGALTVDELKRHQGHEVTKDYYNGFTNPELDKLLKEKEVSELYLTGLVQEVCIKENALGALEHGYKVNVIVDATVPFNSYAGYNALKELEQKGARLIDLETALKEINK